MNVPKDYDDDAERLRTHPLLLPKEDNSGELSTENKNVLKKTTNNISLALDVKFIQRTLLRPQVLKPQMKEMGQKSMPQRVTNQVATPLKHRRSVSGDHNNRSAQYRRYLEMKGRGQTQPRK